MASLYIVQDGVKLVIFLSSASIVIDNRLHACMCVCTHICIYTYMYLSWLLYLEKISCRAAGLLQNHHELRRFFFSSPKCWDYRCVPDAPEDLRTSETGSQYVAFFGGPGTLCVDQNGLEFIEIHPPLYPKCWN